MTEKDTIHPKIGVWSRMLRFSAWALLMLTIFVVCELYAPRYAKFAPIWCLPLMVPMVLIPFRRTHR